MIYHITPENDLKEHILESTCACNPRSETQPGGDILLIHNSYDGREALELANEILEDPEPPKHPNHLRYAVEDGILYEVHKTIRREVPEAIKEVNKPDCSRTDWRGDPL